MTSLYPAIAKGKHYFSSFSNFTIVSVETIVKFGLILIYFVICPFVLFNNVFHSSALKRVSQSYNFLMTFWSSWVRYTYSLTRSVRKRITRELNRQVIKFHVVMTSDPAACIEREWVTRTQKWTGHPINESPEQGLIYLCVNIYTSSVKKTFLWLSLFVKASWTTCVCKGKSYEIDEWQNCEIFLAISPCVQKGLFYNNSLGGEEGWKQITTYSTKCER